jgi:hypothetical protein
MPADPSPKTLLIQMFRDMVEQKNTALIERFYHPAFVLETNGETQDFAAFAAGHRRVYATDITYAIRYDDAAWVEAPGRVAARVWITTQTPGRAAVEFEVVLIATVRNGQFYRIWETTWPDWRATKSFDTYHTDSSTN